MNPWNRILLGVGLIVLTQNAMAADAGKKMKAKAKPVVEEAAKAADQVEKKAEEVSSGSISGYKYGMAGCGVGSMLFKSNTKGPQIAASFVDNPWPITAVPVIGQIAGLMGFVRLGGITTGTLNCEVPAGKVSATDSFIHDNFVALQNDAARGQGEAIESLAKTLGCSDTSRVGAELHRNYSTIFKGGNQEKADAKREIFKALTPVCGELS